MTDTESQHIKQMVADLDAAVPRDGAQVHLSQYGGGPDESRVVATQQGYLRLGIEFLSAAFAPPSHKSPEQIDLDLSYLLTPDSSVGFDWFERREQLTDTHFRMGTPGRLAQLGFGLLLFAGCILAVIGLISVIRWFL